MSPAATRLSFAFGLFGYEVSSLIYSVLPSEEHSVLLEVCGRHELYCVDCGEMDQPIAYALMWRPDHPEQLTYVARHDRVYNTYGAMGPIHVDNVVSWFTERGPGCSPTDS